MTALFIALAFFLLAIGMVAARPELIHRAEDTLFLKIGVERRQRMHNSFAYKAAQNFYHQQVYPLCMRVRFCFARRPSDPPEFTVQPNNIRLEASPVCQLRCPSCPTTQGIIGKSRVGMQLLSFTDFKALIDRSPWIASVELANWGEIFLNPELLDILKYAHEKNVRLTVGGGANFNHVREDVLEALVKYQVAAITCSIDGASQETYAKYRVRGHFDRVIANIRRVNEYKQQYNSSYPALSWQYILFEHNKHEVKAARELAAELDMNFFIRMSWDRKLAAKKDKQDLPESPVSTTARAAVSVPKQTAKTPCMTQALASVTLPGEAGPAFKANKAIKELKQGREAFLKTMCTQLWNAPQINSDGKILGCCVNHWGDFGNAFQAPDVLEALNNDDIVYARKMLAGQAAPKKNIPCTGCEKYRKILRTNDWMTQKDLEECA